METTVGTYTVTYFKPGYARGVYPQPDANCTSIYMLQCYWDEIAAWEKLGAFPQCLVMKRLCTAKIVQHLKDLCIRNLDAPHQYAREAAKEWLFGDGTDFWNCCIEADVAPERVQKAAMKILAGEINLWHQHVNRARSRKKYATRKKVLADG